MTAPRADDDPVLLPLLEKARRAVADGADGGVLLARAEFAPLHELGAFRQLVRAHAPLREVRVPLEDEPGQPLLVRCRVEDRAGRPVAGALVYAYQTSAKGWYSDRAPHFSGNSGDVGHARLFAYVRTDPHGVFVLHTIRPGGYPRSTLPEHIHVHVDVGDSAVLGTELMFADDPRLKDAARAQAQRAGFEVLPVTKTEDEAGRELQLVEAKLVVEVPAETPAEAPRAGATVRRRG